MAISLIELIDGADDCDPPSHLGVWGILLWGSICVYLFLGLYVLCDHYFLPVLIEISKRLKMSEDVAGATLMACGSSAPELFTAMIGVLVYPDQNPGPSTNGASAAFNMCVIIGCSIFFSGYQSFQIRAFPFLRDCFFYAVTIVELYLFYETISPGVIEWGESFVLVLSWCGYIVVLMYNERVIALCERLKQWMAGLAERCAARKGDEAGDGGDGGDGGDAGGSYIAMEVLETENTETTDAVLLDAGSRKETRKLKRSQSMPGPDAMRSARTSRARSSRLRSSRTSRRDSMVDSGASQRAFDFMTVPFHFAFRWTVPSGSSHSLEFAKTSLLVGAFCVVMVWLGILNFICVDAAEKIGNCLEINDDVMGLTLLAIGSSLPDCFSSILAAKKGKGEMAVSNAMGSNVFDLGICIGVSMLTSSAIKGFGGISVSGNDGFAFFIAALLVMLVLFMVAMFCGGLVLTKKIGGGLLVMYLLFLAAFCYLLQFD